MREAVVAGLLLFGGAISLIAGLGLVVMPDLFTRIQASAKAATLGTGCLLLAVAIDFADAAIVVRSLLTILFLFITAPVAAHVIGRAAYVQHEALWEGTVIDEMACNYDPTKQVYHSPSWLEGEEVSKGQ